MSGVAPSPILGDIKALQRAGLLRMAEVDQIVYASDARYGGFWNGTDNDSPAIQAALDEAAALSPRATVVLPPNFCMRDSVFAQINVHIVGHAYSDGKVNSVMRPHANASFSTGFAFNLNTLDGVNPRANVYDRPYVNALRGIFANNFSALLSGWGLVCAFGGTIIRDIYGSRMPRLIKKPNSAAGNNYTDNWIIERIHEYLDGNELFYNLDYAIDIGQPGGAGSGDAVQINQLNMPMPEAGPRKAVRIKNSSNALITNIINGSMAFDDCGSINIINYHSESGQIVMTRSDVSISGSNWAVKDGQTYYPIECYGQIGNTGSYALSLKDVSFRYGPTTYKGGAAAEIKTDPEVAIYIDNAKRVAYLSGSEGTQTGIRLHTSGGAALAAWNDHSHYLSARGIYARGQTTGQLMQKVIADFNGIYSPFVPAGWVSTLGAGTYYYRAQLVAKLSPYEGRTQLYSEISQTITANQSIGFSMDFGACTPFAMIRFYRGTAAGSYDKYVDIPCMNANSFVDDGNTLAGWAWTSRAAGAMDTITTLNASYLTTPAGRVAVA